MRRSEQETKRPDTKPAIIKKHGGHTSQKQEAELPYLTEEIRMGAIAAKIKKPGSNTGHNQ